ncbi:MAG: VOC family protein [Bacteroidota bacterium]|nr:VOC family protein [Bacteroidota bacterium]
MKTKITPFLWFNGKAGEAADFYTSIFKNSKVLGSSPGPEGIMSATVELEGQRLILFNGGPMFKFTEAFSLSVSCETQEEIDEKWEKLIAGGGQESRCGWLKDKYGLSWQIVPPILEKLLSDPDQEKSKRALNAMFKMNKIIIKDLQDAYEGK